jgi:hypothetical protein
MARARSGFGSCPLSSFGYAHEPSSPLARSWLAPWHDDCYALTNWKRRSAFVVFCAGTGLWDAHIFHRLLCVFAGIEVALLKIWWEARRA